MGRLCPWGHASTQGSMQMALMTWRQGESSALSCDCWCSCFVGGFLGLLFLHLGPLRHHCLWWPPTSEFTASFSSCRMGYGGLFYLFSKSPGQRVMWTEPRSGSPGLSSWPPAVFPSLAYAPRTQHSQHGPHFPPPSAHTCVSRPTKDTWATNLETAPASCTLGPSSSPSDFTSQMCLGFVFSSHPSCHFRPPFLHAWPLQQTSVPCFSLSPPPPSKSPSVLPPEHKI